MEHNRKARARNEMAMDAISTQQANLFHERRVQTDYLVSLEDLEPEVSDMITQAHIKTDKV